MTNSVAIGLGLLIAAFLGLCILLGLDWHIFLAREFIGLVEYLAFWR